MLCIENTAIEGTTDYAVSLKSAKTVSRRIDCRKNHRQINEYII
jgi:hypothetical protein